MGGIVILTTEGNAKREFANRLYDETQGRVDFVVIQKTPPKSFGKRLKGYVDKVGLVGLPRELWYTMLWFFSPRVRHAHGILKSRTSNKKYEGEWNPKTMVVESVNADVVKDVIKGLSPELIVIWGGMIVKNEIINCAPKAINMHFGYCPFYRGANANHHAIIKKDFEHIGITIHYAVKEVDAGEILSVIQTDRSKSFSELFRDLNDRAESEYRSIAIRLLNKEKAPSHPQNLLLGKNYRMKEWTYEKQYLLGKTLTKNNF